MAVHLVPSARPKHTPPTSSHGRNSIPRTGPQPPCGIGPSTSFASSGSMPVPVVDHAGDAAQQEERQEDVEQGQPGQHEVQPVEAQQQAGDTAEGGRAGQPPGQPDHHQHHQRPDDGGGDPPAERVHAERLLPERDQPLADLGVHDHRRVGVPDARGVPVQDVGVDVGLGVAVRVAQVLLDVPEVQQRPGVLGVVGLVERHHVRAAEPVEPQQEREHRDAEGGRPADPRVGAGQPAAGAFRRGRDRVAGSGGRKALGMSVSGLRVEGGHEPEQYGDAMIDPCWSSRVRRSVGWPTLRPAWPRSSAPPT